MNPVSLGSVAEFVNGYAFKPRDWEDNDLPIIRIQNLTDQSRPFNRTNAPVATKFRVEPGDLLVSWSATLGAFVWSRDEPGLVNQHIFRVKPFDDRIAKSYLKHMLRGALVDMERHLHGATMRHINRKEFLDTYIPLPPLDEQRRIVDILDRADALRAKRRETIAHIDTLTRSIFHDMFGDPIGNPFGWDEDVELGDLASQCARATILSPVG